MLAVLSPQCLQHSCAPHASAAYATHGHATYFTPQLQEYQHLLLQQIQQLQQQLASQHAGTHIAPTPHCSAAAARASPVRAAATCTHGQQHQQQGCQDEWHGDPYCQLTVSPTVRQHLSSSNRCQQVLYAEGGEAGSFESQESIHQKTQNSCQQQQQLTTYSSSCISFSNQDHCAAVCNKRSNNPTHGPLRKHNSHGISRALFGSPTATTPQSSCNREKGQSCNADTVHTYSTSTAVASGYSGIHDSHKPADLTVADLCQRQQSSLAMAGGPSDRTDKTCPASADASLQTPELCTTACWQGRSSGSSAGNSQEAQDTSGAAHHAIAGAAALPTAAPCSTDASPARLQCLVEQLEQRLAKLHNLLHTPALDASPQKVDARQGQGVAVISPAQQAGAGPAPLLGSEQSESSDGTSAVVATATVEVHVASNSSSSDGDPGGMHVQRQSITDASLGSRQQCGSPAALASAAAAPQPAQQQQQGLYTAAIVQREPLACEQQGHEQESHEQQRLGRQTDQQQDTEQQSNEKQKQQQEPWQRLPRQSKGQHLDLSRGGAALLRANACSDKLMFALLLASKKFVEC